jgi:hypothetical protein
LTGKYSHPLQESFRPLKKAHYFVAAKPRHPQRMPNTPAVPGLLASRSASFLAWGANINFVYSLQQPLLPEGF